MDEFQDLEQNPIAGITASFPAGVSIKLYWAVVTEVFVGKQYSQGSYKSSIQQNDHWPKALLINPTGFYKFLVFFL